MSSRQIDLFLSLQKEAIALNIWLRGRAAHSLTMIGGGALSLRPGRRKISRTAGVSKPTAFGKEFVIFTTKLMVLTHEIFFCVGTYVY